MKLYIDFDGVILNTIEVSYKRIREQYGENPTHEDSAKFYRSINWNKFLNECTPINNGLENLQKLIDSKLFDVTVLTHVLSKHEEEVKKAYLKKNVPDLKFIPVTKPNPKWSAIDCVNAILVDDYSENLKEWQEHGGIAIKFTEKQKKYNYHTIKSLDELIDLYPIIRKEITKKRSLIK